MSMAAAAIRPTPDLRQLLSGLADAPPLPLTGIADDSRRVEPGNLFVAWQGETVHGLEYAGQAIAAGAAAVAWDRSTGDAALAEGAVPFVAVDRLAAHLGDIANRWYGTPSADLRVAGVTGTNGKTTVAFLLAQALKRLDRPCGYVGTLGHGCDELEADLGLTTPACLDLHRLLAGFRDSDARYAAVEVSSHGLTQGRVDGVRFDAAVFTNLSRDHIDYHADMREYGESKARLFTEFDARHRIINVDDPFGAELARRCPDGLVAVASRGQGRPGAERYVQADRVDVIESGFRVSIDSTWGVTEITVPLAGDFNVSNVLLVLALLLAWDLSLPAAAEVIGRLAAPPGRLQRVAAAADASVPAVYVDYAHTPAALEAALNALRGHTRGELWCVFGCGGDRDRGKRPLMGEAASRGADRSIVTNDNPRSESPDRIIADILAGMEGGAIAIEDRGTAIAHAIREAGEGDTVLIAGKGHEDYQIIGRTRLDFSDYQCASANLEARAPKGGDR